MKFKKIFIVLLSVLLLLNSSVSVFADNSATDSFTHNDNTGTQIVLSMPDVFQFETLLNSRTLGVDIDVISDICCDSEGNLYILSEVGKLFKCNSKYELIEECTITYNDGKSVDFSGAKGVSVYDNEIYIADTLNSRVLRCKDGKIKSVLAMPESGLIPSDFEFSPTKAQKDAKGYTYVISEGSYYGAVMYDPDYKFAGFYGANTVKSNVLTTLASVWDNLISNDIKRAKKVKTLPYQFVDICISAEDFIYTCTGQSADETGQLKMLSPGGTNILYKKQSNGTFISSSSFAFGEQNYVQRKNKKIRQNFASIDVDEKNMIYALDKTYGLIYVYDSQCNLITAFGGGRGLGTRKGTFTSVVSITVSNDKIFVADNQNNSVSVFSLTDFGYELIEAQSLALDSKYTEAAPHFENVLKKDARNNLAILGLAKYDVLTGNYKAALEKAKVCSAYGIYSQALKYVIDDFINNNFVWLFIGAVIFIAVVIAVCIILKKKNVKIIKNEKIIVFLNGFIHPFDSYGKIRYKNMGSLKLAIGLMVLFYFSSVLSVLCSNFRFTSFDSETYNSLFQLAQTAGLILLFAVANWGISVLLQGIGKLKHVFIVTCYSTFPISIYNLIIIPITFLLTSPESALIGGLQIFAYILTAMVLCVGLMKVHDFSFPRFLVSVLVAVFFMFLIVFVVFVFCILISQLWGFIAAMIIEVVYR